MSLAKQADTIYAAKGKMVVRIDMKKDKPGEETLARLLLGPTGNLRAPTLRVGRTLIVGFEQGMYETLLQTR
jgi:hypothetical protein